MVAAGLHIAGRPEWGSVVNVLRHQHYDNRPFATARVGPGEHRVEVRTYDKTMNDVSCVVFHKRSERSELIVEVLEP